MAASSKVHRGGFLRKNNQSIIMLHRREESLQHFSLGGGGRSCSPGLQNITRVILKNNLRQARVVRIGCAHQNSSWPFGKCAK